MTFEVIHGDCLEVMAGMEAGSVDAVVCDPPYGLEFMGKEWDRLDWRDGGGMSKCGLGNRKTEWVSYGGETANATCAKCGGRMRGANKCSCESPDWRVKGEAYSPRTAQRAAAMQAWHQDWAVEALRVLKPSHYLLAFGGTRTWHRLACALEDAGFEIRDTLMWLYGSGFPKGRACLKPAWEPVILARKPGPMRELGIEECRIGTNDAIHKPGPNGGMGGDAWRRAEGRTDRLDAPYEPSPAGRWPANLVLDEEAAGLVDEQSGWLNSPVTYTRSTRAEGEWLHAKEQGTTQLGHGDSGGASRFYYCAKASRAERNAGLEGIPERDWSGNYGGIQDNRPHCPDGYEYKATVQNHHPTVKPVALMRWLVRLVARPGDTVLDPFTGSGTTGVACVEEGREFVGIEREAEYVEIARRRIEAAAAQTRLPV